MTADLVPLQRVSFSGGRWPAPAHVIAVEPLPRDTMDPRYPFCREHRIACVCREAELSEQMNEHRYYLDAVREAALDVLAGHRLFHYAEFGEPGYDPTLRGSGPLACQCTGCRLMRPADIGGLLLHCDENGVVLTAEQRDERRREYELRRRQATRPARPVVERVAR